MKRYTPYELQTVISEHAKWVVGEGGARADLSGANLSGANLYRANLYRADLYGANLYGVKVKTSAAFNGLYKYIAMPVVAEDGTEYIHLGCKFHKVSEWAENFWNNPGEFPNNGDTASKDRWNAYQACLRWLEARREEKMKEGAA